MDPVVEKRSGGKLTTPNQFATAKAVRTDLLNQKLRGTMLSDAKLGLGLGVGAVGAHRLLKLLVSGMQRREPPEDVTSLHFPARGSSAKDKKKEKQASLDKEANNFVEYIKSIFSGGEATNVNELPLGRAARASALLAGIGGGAWGTNKLLGGVKNYVSDKELADARREFQAALHGTNSESSQDPTETEAEPKYKLAAAMDRLEKAAATCGVPQISRLDKQAGGGLGSNMSNALSLYALMAMLSAGTAGYYGYNSGKKEQKGRKYELAYKAKKQRMRQRDPLSPVAVTDDPEVAAYV